MPRRNGDRPNIVYIDCHDLGDWLGCYGRPDLHTPHLDELASAGARFGMHIATAPICIPSRSSMYTGSLPHEVGVIGQEPLAPGTICMAAHFRRAGYRTVLCGRLMIPNDVHWVGFADQIATVPEEQAAAAAAFLESQRGDSAPFLLQVSFTQCHRPFGAAFDPELPERIAVPPYLPDTDVTRRDLATLAWQIHDMDDRIGRILAAIDSAGLRERTLVVFTTEHGPAVARAKHTIYDSGLRTALLMRLPGVIAPGRTIDELSSNVDLLPTLTDLCRLERPQGIQGTSWAGQLAGDEPAAPLRRWAFSQLNWGRRSGRWYYTPARSIRTSRYKLIRSYRRVPIFVDNGWLARHAGDRPTVERRLPAGHAALRPDRGPVRAARPGRRSRAGRRGGATAGAPGPAPARHRRPRAPRAGRQPRGRAGRLSVAGTAGRELQPGARRSGGLPRGVVHLTRQEPRPVSDNEIRT